MILVKNTLHKGVFETIIKACSINFPQRFNCCSLYCSSLSFCFYLASFAFSFSHIVHYAPSRSKQSLLS